MNEEKAKKFIDCFMNDLRDQWEKAYREALIAGEGWLKVHPDGHFEYIRRFFGCDCGDAGQTSEEVAEEKK